MVIEHGARAMFLEMRREVDKNLPWEALPEGARADWRRGFARALCDIADLPGMVVTSD
jgi:hypothetical protein